MSESVHGQPLEDPPSAKFQRGLVILQIATSETWSQDGGKDDLIAAVEGLMGANSSRGTGPGGVVLHALGIATARPRTPDGDTLDKEIEKFRIEYPLLEVRPAFSAYADTVGVAKLDQPFTPGTHDYRHPEPTETIPFTDASPRPASERGVVVRLPDLGVVIAQGAQQVVGGLPATALDADMHQPPAYPAESLDFSATVNDYDIDGWCIVAACWSEHRDTESHTYSGMPDVEGPDC